MNNPGTVVLGDVALAAINAATTQVVVTLAADAQGVNQPYVDQLDGMLAATIDVNLAYGSGGTTLKVMIDTTLNDGTTWVEVARIAFTTASAERLVNLSGLTPKTTPVVPQALSDDTCLDGIFGNAWRARILTTGTYAGNTSLSIRMNAR